MLLELLLNHLILLLKELEVDVNLFAEFSDLGFVFLDELNLLLLRYLFLNRYHIAND